MSQDELLALMAETAAATEAELTALLADPAVPEPLASAMRHATLGAGKRLRPFLVHAAAGLGRADAKACTRVGAAVELVHCYSLVHDDLPAMDDAPLRRGKPSCHKAFGEAVAILAGDALVALAFEALARSDWPGTAETKLEVIAGLGRASGGIGMCGGQMLDLASGDSPQDETALTQLQTLKTGAIIAFALDAGCMLASLDAKARAAVGRYAAALGLAFQIQDDILDELGSVAETGKAPGRDQSLGRATFVSCLGVQGAQERLLLLKDNASTSLDSAALSSTLLMALFDFVINRRS